jgi:hypothetical protein
LNVIAEEQTCAAVTWTFAAAAQEPGRIYRLGGLSVGSRTAPYWLGVFDELRLVERFQSSNHMGCLKRPHPWDGTSKMQLWGFTESVV